MALGDFVDKAKEKAKDLMPDDESNKQNQGNLDKLKKSANDMGDDARNRVDDTSDKAQDTFDNAKDRVNRTV